MEAKKSVKDLVLLMMDIVDEALEEHKNKDWTREQVIKLVGTINFDLQ